MAYTIVIGFIIITISLFILGVKWASKYENKTQEAEAKRRKEETAKRKAQEKALEEEKVKVQDEQCKKYEERDNKYITEFKRLYGITPDGLKQQIRNSKTAITIAEKIDSLPKHPLYIGVHSNYMFAPLNYDESHYQIEDYNTEVKFELQFSDLGLHNLPDSDSVTVLIETIAKHSKFYEQDPKQYHVLKLSSPELEVNENLFANW
ncbi:MAG: hypothetical protein LUH56_04030 [Oscillospiraceae bacterium]|nr:hypothetical protein [Oscillospiraceae bacterium]